MKIRISFALIGALISSGIVLFGVATHSRAAMYVEAEASNATTNNSLAGAEIISAPLFTMPEPANVFPRSGSFTATISGLGGNGDVDFYKFSFPENV